MYHFKEPVNIISGVFDRVDCSMSRSSGHELNNPITSRVSSILPLLRAQNVRRFKD